MATQNIFPIKETIDFIERIHSSSRALISIIVANLITLVSAIIYNLSNNTLYTVLIFIGSAAITDFVILYMQKILLYLQIKGRIREKLQHLGPHEKQQLIYIYIVLGQYPEIPSILGAKITENLVKAKILIPFAPNVMFSTHKYKIRD